MAQNKKDGVFVNIYAKKEIADKLSEFCKKTGQTKTVVIERGIEMYIDYMEKHPNAFVE